jgi:hypothetical protein
MHRTALFLALALASATPFAQESVRHIDKINGRIVAEAGQQYGNLDTVNGSIELGNGVRAADVETVNGSIRGGNDVAAADVSTVNGSIHLGERARIGGSVETVNGSLFIGRGGDVRGGVSTVNGGIGLVDTDVSGDVGTVNGDITVGAGSHVRGGIKVEQPGKTWLPRFGKPRVPRIVVGPNAVVDGPLVFEREVRLHVHASARIGPVTGATAQRYATPRAPRD